MSHPMRLERHARFIGPTRQEADAPERVRRRLPKWQLSAFLVALVVAILDGVALTVAPAFVNAPTELALICILLVAMLIMAAIVKRSAVHRVRH